MDECANGIGLGCNGFPGTIPSSGGFPITGGSNQQGVTPDLVNPANNAGGGGGLFLQNLPDLLGSLTGGFADVYGAIQGIPQAPDNVTYVTYQTPTEEKGKSGPTQFILVLLAIIVAIVLIVWAISRSKK